MYAIRSYYVMLEATREARAVPVARPGLDHLWPPRRDAQGTRGRRADDRDVSRLARVHAPGTRHDQLTRVRTALRLEPARDGGPADGGSLLPEPPTLGACEEGLRMSYNFV